MRLLSVGVYSSSNFKTSDRHLRISLCASVVLELSSFLTVAIGGRLWNWQDRLYIGRRYFIGYLKKMWNSNCCILWLHNRYSRILRAYKVGKYMYS